jgi:hypothetical protein
MRFGVEGIIYPARLAVRSYRYNTPLQHYYWKVFSLFRRHFRRLLVQRRGSPTFLIYLSLIL